MVQGLTVSRAAQSPNPHIANTARQMAGQYTPSGVDRRSRYERIISALTDKHAIVGTVEQEIRAASGPLAAGPRDAAGRAGPREPEQHRRPARTEELGPAIQSVGEDTDWLEQILVHAHNADVAAAKGQEAYDAAITAGRAPAAA